MSGLVYDVAILGAVGPMMPLAFAMAGAAWAQTRAVLRAQGKPPVRSQKLKLAFGHAVSAVIVLGVLAIAMGPTKLVVLGTRVELATLTGGKLATFLGGLVGSAIALFALHVALLGLFSLGLSESAKAARRRGVA